MFPNIKHGVFWELQIVLYNPGCRIYAASLSDKAGEGSRSPLPEGPTVPIKLRSLDSIPKGTGQSLKGQELLRLHIQIVIISHIAIFSVCGFWG